MMDQQDHPLLSIIVKLMRSDSVDMQRAAFALVRNVAASQDNCHQKLLLEADAINAVVDVSIAETNYFHNFQLIDIFSTTGHSKAQST